MEQTTKDEGSPTGRSWESVTAQVNALAEWGCPLARELRVLRGMCSCGGDMDSVHEAEVEYLRLRERGA